MHSLDGSIQTSEEEFQPSPKDFEGAAQQSTSGKRQPDAADGPYRQFVSGGISDVGMLMMRPTLFDEVGLLDEIFSMRQRMSNSASVCGKKENGYFIVHRHRFCTTGRDCREKALEQAQLGASQGTWVHVPQTQFFTFKQKDRTVNLLK